MTLATDCICGKHMLQRANDGTCLWCGHGPARPIIEYAYIRNLERNASPVLSGVRLPVATTSRVLDTRAAPAGGRRREWDADGCVAAARRWEAERGHLPTSTEWQAPKDGFERPSYPQVRFLFGGWAGFLREIADVPRERIAA